MGLDATVQDNRIDFVFKNSTSADIFIDGEYYKGKNGYYRCKFTIWGRPDPSGNTYKLVSEVKEPIPIPEMVYKKDKDMKYVVYDDEQHQTSKGQEGYIVDVYRVTLDRNGNEIARDKAYTDTYKAVAPVTYVGVMPRPTPVPTATPDMWID
jgi:vancomycin resistance protein YoaR